MGAGIAQVCALANYKVKLFDIQQDMLEKARKGIIASLKKMSDSGKIDPQTADDVLSGITFTTDLVVLKADLIIEAVVERADVKIELFQKLMELNGPETLYASNTSSIPITQIAAGLNLPHRFLGIHFFNPAQIMKLVEVIKGAKTDENSLNQALEFVKSLKKVPVVAADAPGFIVNRIARLFYVESLKILEEQVCSLETIDNILESSGFKMGPFRLMDLIGVDTNYSVTESQFKLFNYEPRFRPSRIQKQKVDAGMHGKKTGEGFYKYE